MPMSQKEAKELTYKVASPEGKVAEIAKDIKGLEKKQKQLSTISSEEDYAAVTDIAVSVKGRIKRIKELKKEYVKPLKDAVKNVESMFNEPLKHYEGMETAIKSQMSTYRIEQEKIARKEEERLRKLREKREERAKAKGKEIVDPTPMPTVERAESTVRTDAGKTTTKKVWRHEITDSAKALTVEETKNAVLELAVSKGLLDQVLRAKVKAGVREHDGVRIYEDVDISITA